jgi:hypothetical protein
VPGIGGGGGCVLGLHPAFSGETSCCVDGIVIGELVSGLMNIYVCGVWW